MAARFIYSRWDGTQKGFELDAETVFDAITDDLLYHGDVNSALRRMMQEGFRDRNGDQLQGLREIMDRLRKERQERLDRGDLGGVFQEIADALNDIIDEERHAVENAKNAAEASGDERRAETARQTADERNFRLDMLPDDLAGKVRELQAYDFESAEARQRFEECELRAERALDHQTEDRKRRCPGNHHEPGAKDSGKGQRHQRIGDVADKRVLGARFKPHEIAPPS